MHLLPIVNKARKPKFDLHLKIYDLNNVPLVSGTSLIKWHLPHSIHGEHRGRTPKCPIANHRVEYHYSRIIPVRIGIDRSDRLVECPIEFEVLQEFSSGSSRDEKITLGRVALNLSEYVEESEAILREGSIGPGRRSSIGGVSDVASKGHSRKRSSASGLGLSLTRTKSAEASGVGLSPTSSHAPTDDRLVDVEVEDGVVRRYLMQDSKINSTLKIGILMIQVDGERNFVAPPLKTAPVFGGIAGIVAGDQQQVVAEQLGQDDLLSGFAGNGGHELPTALSSKSRDASELQDMYRRALAASWTCQPGELPADECIEDIFAGGDGWKGKSGSSSASTPTTPSKKTGGGGVSRGVGRSRAGFAPPEDSGSASGDEAEEAYDMAATLRPRDVRHIRHHMRHHSGSSDKSTGTVTAGSRLHMDRGGQHQRHEAREDKTPRTRGESLASLATTLESERVRGGFKRAKEVGEVEVRDDMVAWRLPERVA
ncbi:N-terminal C2 in EEIG1 and EHBP1 proteins-domain-containing protein [Pleurostoma richardsiae]|uniref:N-terminal C2 in EEIG1 and EHBP1 proteins-domain-containing protein n=1 Tax=Pleurostoma richardsiae TaxID=41990 RepID=A0AA38RR97_9PEZI|nr:N-terminal C2 in EEIG1 and EHBP1 proteins-domain-containing protein [Pleurostoma richardsiae]